MTVPHIFFRLTVGQIDHLYVTFIVPYDELAAEDVLLRLPLQQNFGIDTNTMLDKNRKKINGAGCSDIQLNVSEGGTGNVERVMIAKMNYLRAMKQETLL